jgi:hypothetical protein
MARAKGRGEAATELPDTGWRLELPPPERPSEEELERRRVLFERTIALRDKIGPIGIRTDELIRQVREEADGSLEW